jgi:circadian clock protein KaiB
MNKFKLELFLIKKTLKSKNLIMTLNMILKEEFDDEYTLEIIDVLENLYRTNKDEIFITPTLVRTEPKPVKKIFGDFSNRETLKIFLRN